MHILGFDCYGHDSAAAIFRDGDMLGLVEEERFLRKKHVADFPKHAIQWCCDIAGIKPADLDHIVYYWDPSLAYGPRIMHLLQQCITSSAERLAVLSQASRLAGKLGWFRPLPVPNLPHARSLRTSEGE